MASNVRPMSASAVPSLDANDAAARFSTQQYNFGLQDDWQVNDTLLVSIGARYDLQGSNSKVPANLNFLARAGFPNNYTFNGKGTFQPRVGFEWDATDRLIIRGGVGKFAGGAPDVFLSNSFSNTGQLTNSVNIVRNATGCNSGDAAFCNAALTAINGTTFAPVVNTFLTTNTASLTAAPVAAIAPGYDLPALWRATLSASYELGDGWLVGADVLYGWTEAANTYIDTRSVVIGTLPDGRPRYARTTQGILAGDTNQVNQDLVLNSTSKGRSIFAVARFDKRFDFGLGLGASYTYQNIKDVNPITSATPGSLYGNAAMADPNLAAYGRSIYEVRNSAKFNIDYDHAFFGDYKTRFSIFGEWRTGRPYSYTMRDAGSTNSVRSPVFGTNGSNTRYLLYVPSGIDDAKVSYDSVATRDALDAFISGSKLDGHRGAITPKNLGTSPSVWKIDLHLEQEIPTFIGSSRISVFADVENFLNMLNSDWGVQRQVNFAYFAPVVNVQCLTVATPTATAPGTGVVNSAPTQTCAQYRYSSFSKPDVVNQNQARQSLYQIKVGVRFEF